MVSGIAVIAAACWPKPRRWVLLELIILGTVPFAALAGTALVPVLLMLVTAAVAVPLVRETGPAGASGVSVPSGSEVRRSRPEVMGQLP